MSDPQKSRDQIFICYRRDDSSAVTGRIYDRLIQKFGKEAIFKDIDSIPLGRNFKQHIDSTIRQCNVVLVVIGDKWMEQGRDVGQRRIDDPRDYVRIEIESALVRDIPVIPVLVQNASMPSEEALPETMREFSYRHGISISNDPHFHVDMNRLIQNLEPYLNLQPKAEDQNLERTSGGEPTPIPEATEKPFTVAFKVNAENRGRIHFGLTRGIGGDNKVSYSIDFRWEESIGDQLETRVDIHFAVDKNMQDKAASMLMRRSLSPNQTNFLTGPILDRAKDFVIGKVNEKELYELLIRILTLS